MPAKYPTNMNQLLRRTAELRRMVQALRLAVREAKANPHSDSARQLVADRAEDVRALAATVGDTAIEYASAANEDDYGN